MSLSSHNDNTRTLQTLIAGSTGFGSVMSQIAKAEVMAFEVIGWCRHLVRRSLVWSGLVWKGMKSLCYVRSDLPVLMGHSGNNSCLVILVLGVLHDKVDCREIESFFRASNPVESVHRHPAQAPHSSIKLTSNLSVSKGFRQQPALYTR